MSEIAPSVRVQLLDHMRSVLPNEGCGYLVGDPETGRIDRFVAITNAAASPTRFVLDAPEQLAAEMAIEAAGEQVIGVAHSHPTGEPVPSATDVGDAAAYDPFGVFIHVLVAPASGEIRRFRIADGRVDELVDDDG